MECKIKYTIIEVYPSIIKHKIPLIAIILFLIYSTLFILIYTYMIFKNIGSHSLSLIKQIFIPLKDIQFIKGSNNMVDFELGSTNVNDSNIDKELEGLKEKISHSYIKNYLRKDSNKLLEKLIQKKCISSDMLEFLPNRDTFVMKEEIIYFSDKEIIDHSIFFNDYDNINYSLVTVTKGYNLAAVLTYKLYNNSIKKILNIK